MEHQEIHYISPVERSSRVAPVRISFHNYEGHAHQFRSNLFNNFSIFSIATFSQLNPFSSKISFLIIIKNLYVNWLPQTVQSCKNEQTFWENILRYSTQNLFSDFIHFLAFSIAGKWRSIRARRASAEPSKQSSSICSYLLPKPHRRQTLQWRHCNGAPPDVTCIRSATQRRVVPARKSVE